MPTTTPRRTSIGRKRPKAHSGCWSCKKRKVKCSEEKPICRACARLQLPCQYGLRLQWGDESQGFQVPDQFQVCNITPAPSSRKRESPLHFVQFTVQDFESKSGLAGEDERGDPGSGSWSASLLEDSETSQPSWSSPSSQSLSLIEEPSWFPPLDLSTSRQNDELLFAYYVLEICPRCTMYDDSSNGFRTIIVPMSVNHPTIMHSILAVAAFYRRYEDPAYHVSALEQKENALIHLRPSFGDDPALKHEEMIAAAIMLCVFEIKDGSGPNWDRHIHGGRSILRAKVRTDGSGLWSDGISWWANKFFGYQYVIGASAEKMGDSSVFTSPTFWLSQGMDFQEIDGFMGSSSELMAATSEMSIMAKEGFADETDEADYRIRARNIERRLFKLMQRSRHVPMTLSEDSNLLDAVNTCLVRDDASVRGKMLLITAEARRQAALIFLYTCVMGLPVGHTAVQSRVMQCLLCITAVSSLTLSDDSPIWGMTPLIWPLFICGASALEEDDRFKVAEVFSLLTTKKCLGNISRAIDTVKSVWKQNDMAASVPEQQRLTRLFVEPNMKWPLSLG